MRELFKRATEFLFPAESDRWQSVLRWGLGLQVVLYCLSLRSDWSELFFSENAGPIKRDLTEAVLSADSHFIPRIGWLVDLGAQVGLNEQAVLNVAWWSLLFAGVSLLAGLIVRPAAITAWFLHLCAVKSTGSLTYGVDIFTTIGLFYLMIAPVPDEWSLDAWLWKGQNKDRHFQGFHRRVLQLHTCLIYFFGGIAKCAGIGWWDGTSIWRAVTRPPFNVLSPELVISWKHLLPVVGILVCILEISYPFFVWIRKTRLIWFLCILAMHIGIGVAMGMYLFALIMITFNIAAFGPDFSFPRTWVAVHRNWRLKGFLARVSLGLERRRFKRTCRDVGDLRERGSSADKWQVGEAV
jgi:hypothetical protein